MIIVNRVTWDQNTTWWGLAAQYTGSGLNWPHLITANPHIRNPNNVPAGARVTIPQELTR